MTVGETIRDDLTSLGLTTKVVDKIMPEVNKSLIGTHLGDQVSSHPSMYIRVSVDAARATARRWLRENKPKHFAIEALS